MVEIISATPQELKGCRGFGFRTHQQTHEDHELSHEGAEDEIHQTQAVQNIIAAMQTMQTFPCVYNITVDIKNGTANKSGTIQAYDRKARQAAQAALLRLNQLTSSFAVLYPHSSVTITGSQMVTITNVYPKD